MEVFMIGSTWNKWDLHIHSPLTNINNQYPSGDLVGFAQQIKEHNLKLVGITNYWFFAENELEKIRAELKKIDCETTVLGNIEFRIAQPNKQGEWINVHAIFSEKISTNRINDALSKIKIQNTTDAQKTIWCSKKSMDESTLKYHDAYIDFDNLCKGLKESFTLGTEFIIAICPNGYGGFQPDRKEGRSVAVAKEIDKLGDIVLGRIQDRDFFLQNGRYENSLQKPVFLCSDAHGKETIGSKYTWVKSKPNFQGLRQTIFEPAERVQQSDDFVENIFVKPFFSRICLDGQIFTDQKLSFKKSSIPLNKNMVAIIGGRGTGKSLFLDSLRSILIPQHPHDIDRKLDVENISVYLDKGYGEESAIIFNSSNQNPYNYLHVSQGDINKVTQNAEKLSNEIKNMLGIKSHNFDSVDSQALLDNLSKYRNFIDYWNLTDTDKNKINTDTFQNKIIEENQKLIKTLTNPQNKLLITQYQKNMEDINETQLSLDKSKELIAQIDRDLNSLNTRIESYNTLTNIKTKIPQINPQFYTHLIYANSIELDGKKKISLENNEKIKESFIKQGIKEDISSLLIKVSDYQSNIDNAKAKIIEIDQNKAQYFLYIEERKRLSSKYRAYIDSLSKEIDSVFQNLLIENIHWTEEQNIIVKEILSDIEISGRIVFDKNRFYKGLEECINRGKFRNSSDRTTQSRLEETFNVRELDDFFNLISEHKIIKTDNKEENLTIESFLWLDEYFNQGGRYELMHYLFSPENIKNYLYVNAEFTYKGKTVDRLSVGQRGTFYVSLKLATDPFGSPFVFDQPEDDLDNNFIMMQLVPLFRKIKKYRQVIIVTHNANLVINSDAEQVIVAENNGEVINYDMGAIEDGDINMQEGIRHSICSILEGGHVAFSKREKKYGII